MVEGVREMRLTLSSENFELMTRWRAAWADDAAKAPGWAEFIVARARDRGCWPAEKRP
jgi:hypothetical protein